MQSDGQTAANGRRVAIDIVASERERARAFGRARRHTWLVRLLKLALPAVALVCTGLYGVALWTTAELRGAKVAVSNVRIDPSNLTMENPRYEGFSKDGAQYKVRAANAVTDLKMSGPVRLNAIEGELLQTSGVVTRLKAIWGTYDQKKDLLELYERIDVAGTDGMRAKLTRATVQTKENRIITNEPVWAETATGEIKARSMDYHGKTRKAAFRTDVVVTLKPDPAAAEKARLAGPEAQKKAMPVPGLQPASGEPVVITSARLDVDDTAHVAQFRESVVARQGEATLEAPELDVLYEGRTAAPGQKAATPGAPGSEEQRLKTIHARGGVVMTSRADRAESQALDYDAASERVTLTGQVVMTQQPDRRVTAAKAVLDQKADTALMTGNVVVNQARNVMKANRLAIDRKAGTARLASPAEDGRPAGRIYTLFYQGSPDKPAAPGKPAQSEPEVAASPLGPLGAGFKTDPNAPIEVEAATLDVHDRKRTAVYVGQVVAKQGDFVVRTEEMTAHYTGETGLLAEAQPVGPGEAAKAKGKGLAQGPGTAELKRIEARRSVVVTGKDGQQATGEWANFDVKANTIVMGGKVKVAQGKQMVRLPETLRLVIDLTNGVTRTEAEPGAAAAAAAAAAGPQVSGAFSTSATSQAEAKGEAAPNCPKGAVCRSGRLELILYPNQVEKSKVKVAPKAGAAAGGSAAAAAPSADGPATGGSPAGDASKSRRDKPKSRLPEESSWSTSRGVPGSQ